MKPLISSSNNQNTPLMYLFKNTTKIDMINNNHNITVPKSISNIPNDLIKMYYKYKNDLDNNATVLINNNPKYKSKEYFELITTQLKKEGYKFSSINMVEDNKISLKTIINTIPKLNPNISLINLIFYILKFLILLILFTIKGIESVKSQEYTFKEIFTNLLKTKHIKKTSLIINPNHINIDELIQDKDKYHIVNKIKLKDLSNYQDITYIYELYNPEYYTNYLKIKLL